VNKLNEQTGKMLHLSF